MICGDCNVSAVNVLLEAKIWRTGQKILGLYQRQALISTNKMVFFILTKLYYVVNVQGE